MPQLHLYLSKELAAEVKRRADDERMSVSAYLADLVKGRVADDWPKGFFAEVVGGWAGEPLARPPQPPVETRPALTGPEANADAAS